MSLKKRSPPSGGKPKAFAMSIEAKKPSTSSSSTSGGNATKISRGRPKRKALVAMYQSQLSENAMGIKLRLKKALETPIANAMCGKSGGAGSRNNTNSATKRKSNVQMAATTSKTTGKKRQRKSKHKQETSDDDDDSEYEKRRKNNNQTVEKAHRNRKQTTNTTKKPNNDFTEPEEQSVWGEALPEHILLKIFQEAVNQYGSLPTVINVGRVCSLWRRISLSSQLWHTLDLSTWTKDRSEINLKRIIQKHLRWCKDVNLGNYNNK